MILHLLDAELRRNVLRRQTRVVACLAAVGLVAAVGFAMASGDGVDAVGARSTLDGLRGATPLLAAILGALSSGSWFSTGTAVTVTTWASRRVCVPVVEVVAVAVVTSGLAGLVWLFAFVLHAAAAAVSGHSMEGATTSVAGDLGLATGAALVAAAVGGSVGLICRSPTAGTLLLFGGYLFGESIVNSVVQPSLGTEARWLMPITALTQMSGVDTLLSESTGTSPWLIGGTWLVVLLTVGTVAFMRRDLA